jgi:hypothetical protein
MSFVNRAALILLALVCLCAGMPARAQDLPPELKSDSDASVITKAAFQALKTDYDRETVAANKTLLRNRLISIVIAQADVNFASYQRKSRHRRAILGTLLDILEIGTGTAISITNGARAKTVISEALDAERLGRQSLDKNFSLKDTQILINKMAAKRAQIQASILTNMENKGDAQYPLQMAMIDLAAYYKAGTIDGALENLSIDTGAEAQQAIRALEGVKLSKPATEEEATSARDSIDALANLNDELKVAATKDDATKKLKAIVTELEKDKDIVPFLKAANISSAETDGQVLRRGLLNVRRALRSLDPPNFDLLNRVNKVINNIAS